MTGHLDPFDLALDAPLAPHAIDNTDPHPVILTVIPRQWVIPFAREHEADYEFDIEHPAACSGGEDECPLAEYLLCVGIDENLNAGFPPPDDLTEDDLAALDGTVRFLTVTRTYSRWSNADGEDWDVDYDFTWTD